MAFRDVVLAALVEHFSDQDLRVGTPGPDPRPGLGDPVAWFPARHAEVGEASVGVIEVEGAAITIGEILHDHFRNYDAHLGEGERGERAAKDVVRFLRELFADRLLFWRSTDGRNAGWRERGDAGYSKPLVLDNRAYRLYVWSGPLAVWQAVPTILARGRIEDDREYEIVVTLLEDHGPDAFQGAEREMAGRLAAEYDRQRDVEP